MENKKELGLKPYRYNKSNKVELWDVWHLLDLDPFQANILKYIFRYKEKDGSQDLIKAINYCVKMISLNEDVSMSELMKLTVSELNQKNFNKDDNIGKAE